MREQLAGNGGVTVVFDGVGGAVARSAFALLDAGGRMVSFGGASGEWADIAAEDAAARGVTLVGLPRPTPEQSRDFTRTRVGGGGRGAVARAASASGSRSNARPMRTRPSNRARPSARRCWWCIDRGGPRRRAIVRLGLPNSGGRDVHRSARPDRVGGGSGVRRPCHRGTGGPAVAPHRHHRDSAVADGPHGRGSRRVDGPRRGRGDDRLGHGRRARRTPRSADSSPFRRPSSSAA